MKDKCKRCAYKYGTLACCTTVSNKWVYSCKEGMARYKDKKDLKVYELTDKLMQLYIKYLKENYTLDIFKPISELYKFLDTLKGSVAFKVCENAITYGDTQDYFSYDGKRELNFYSEGFIIDDINRDKSFIDYLCINNYFK